MYFKVNRDPSNQTFINNTKKYRYIIMKKIILTYKV